MRDQRLCRGRSAWSSGTGGCRHLLVAGALAVGGAAVIADHAQHVLAVLLVAGEGAELFRHFGRGGVGDAGHDGGERAADGAAGIRVVGNAGRHQQAADIGVAEAQRAEFVGELARSACDGNCAISTEISSTTVHSRTACS